MGWSWALWAVHAPVTAEVAATSSAAPDPLLLEDRRIALRLTRSCALASVYVDNVVVVVGRFFSAVGQRFGAIDEQLGKRGYALHDYVHPRGGKEPLEVVGLHLHGREKRLRPKPSRAWRLYLALHGVLELKAVAVWQLRVLLGHIVS